MNERMSDLLDLASDDGGSPLPFTGDGVAHRARARRRRHGGVAVGLAVAGVAGVLVMTQLVGSSRSDTHGPAQGATTSPSRPSASSAPVRTPEEQAISDRCARLHLPAPADSVTSAQGDLDAPAKGATILDSTTAGPPATFLQSWAVDAYARDAHGLTATFVNPRHTRWARCDVGGDGIRDGGNQIWTAPLPGGPVPRSWYGPNGFRHQGSTVSWWHVCAGGEGKVCGHELFAGALVRYAGVAAAVVDAPDGTVLHPVLGDYTYVFRHTEQRVAANRPADDMQPLPSMPVTLLDGHGHRIIRYDYFPPYVIPASCPPTGGC
jgi:hypothetical protein